VDAGRTVIMIAVGGRVRTVGCHSFGWFAGAAGVGPGRVWPRWSCPGAGACGGCGLEGTLRWLG